MHYEESHILSESVGVQLLCQELNLEAGFDRLVERLQRADLGGRRSVGDT